ncbi:MAG: hypothetical protein KDC44_15930, partial [Phaeodactylibacter sp.]|nr:hypothetical protein [Phaeodactylibacter sp.]
KGAVLDSAFQVFEAPDAYLATYQAVKEARFIADGAFVGENRPGGALLTFWVHPNQFEEKGKSGGKKGKDKKVKIQVVDSAGDTIRTFSVKPDTFMNRISWNLRKDGVRFPSRNEPRNADQLPPGMEVLPGAYELIFTYGSNVGRTSVEVKADPRLDFNRAAMEAKAAAFTDYYALVERATKGFDRLKEAEKTIKAVDQMLLNVTDTTKTAIQKQGKMLKDSLDAYMKLYMMPDDLKGIQRSSENINSYLWRTSNYLDDSNWNKGEASQMAGIYRKKAESAVQEALDRINAFFDSDWKEYRSAVEQLEQPLFKDYEKLE